MIYTHRVDGFDPTASLEDLAYFARQRMEFLKRLYSDKHGIYKKAPPPLGGVVHVFGVTLDREIWKYPKIRDQARPTRAGSTGSHSRASSQAFRTPTTSSRPCTSQTATSA